MLKRFFEFAQGNKFFVLIILLASVLRVVQVSKAPPSLNWDEVSHGYNAYSILETGKDEWGVSFPLIFRAYGDYKLPAYIYLTSISESFFGLSEFAVRLPSVLAGIGTVIFTYLLIIELFQKDKYSEVFTRSAASMATLLFAVEPWSLFLSRAAFEANVALFFIISGFYFFFKALKKSEFLIVSFLFLGLSVWTYNSARIFVPIILLAMIFLYNKEILKNYKRSPSSFMFSITLLLVFLIPMFLQLIRPVGQARYGEVAIIDEGAIAQIIEARQNTSTNAFLARLLYNRPIYFIQRFISNWASHFTCSFLFFKGGSNFQFSIPDQGLLYWINLPLFFVGSILIILKSLSKDKVSLFLLIWLLLAPIPSSLTREAPHVLRSIVMLPVPMIVTAFGLVSVANWLEKRKLLNVTQKASFYIAYILIIFTFGENYLNKYFTEYRKEFSWAWQYGYKEVVNYIKDNYNSYDEIIVTKKYGEPHEFILFYWPWNPEAYRNDPNLLRFYQSNWYWVDRFDKFYFVNDWDMPSEEWQHFVLESGQVVDCTQAVKRCLLITSPGNLPKTWKHLETINFLDGSRAFEIYEN